jgi:hypothetical protein
VIDEMRIEQLLRKYQVGGGASRYHPILFVYGYMTKVCSSRMPAAKGYVKLEHYFVDGTKMEPG